MKTIAVLLFLTILTSCSKSNDDEPQNAFNLDTGTNIAVKNTNGEDLLDPNNPNGYKAENIKLYYLINGKKLEVYDGNLDNPRNFKIYKHESEYRIGITLNDSESETLPITYIEWKPGETDTLQAEIVRTENSVRVIKVWFNSELKWDSQSEEDSFFTITK